MTARAQTRHTSVADEPARSPRAPSGFFTHHGMWAPGVRLFRQLAFTSKAVILSLAFMPLLALLIWQSWETDQTERRARQASLRQHVEVVHGVIAGLHAREQAGEFDGATAQRLARETVATLRYDGSEYFWINDLDARMVMHPVKPELDGKDMSGFKDPNGFALFIAFAETVRAHGGGFVAYQWPKPGSDTPVDKLSYVQGFQPWGWVIGTGVYADDLRNAAWARWQREAVVAGMVLLLAAYLYVSFYKVIDGGLRETRRHLRAMTEGDLGTVPRPWGRDEAAQLMQDLRAMQDSLRAIVIDVRESSDYIATASSQIAAGMSDLSSRTEHTSASLEETAASMGRIAGTVEESAGHASQAAAIADRNSSTAGVAGDTMGKVVATMADIGESSARIEEIIGTIDGIAFQTNILALNAAVEAARAGESGRGFAVVAAEVRLLAQRSSDAAREIKVLIGDNVGRTRVGTQVVHEAGEAIGQMVDNARSLGDLIRRIADGTQLEAREVSQIGQRTQQLDDSTQQNVALVEQTAAATASLEERAQALRQRVMHFRIAA